MALEILTVIGARPQFVKAAPVSRAIRQTGGMHEVIVHTGQHFDDNMSGIFFDELGIPAPEYELNIHGGDHGQMTGRMLAGLERLMLSRQPGLVLVYGDTNSTLAGALAAAKLSIPVAHVEAGLRSFNKRMPEEINRRLTDHLSSVLFCPTRTAVENLHREGIDKEVHHVGDVMFDAAVAAIKASGDNPVLERLCLKPGAYSVATVHRAENTDDSGKLREIIEFLRAQSQQFPIVFPMHPRTRAAVSRHGISLDGLSVCEPLGYLEMVKLLSGCQIVFTDSGGLQKEAYFHRKSCVTLRSETEWVETIECGWNRLWSSPEYAPRKAIADYGSGDASFKIAEFLLRQTITKC